MMFRQIEKALQILWFSICLCCLTTACGQGKADAPALEVPRGYMSTLEIETDDRLLGFGPFVGYYFKPQNPGDLTHLEFVCFNERSFYTRDLPQNTQLFTGDAVMAQLKDIPLETSAEGRIQPIFFRDAPPEWLATRPQPIDAFVHFHSCYDARAAVLTGYWFRHEGLDRFTYDMGGRVGPDSPLYHEVTPGIDKLFARIMEFDRGPE